METSFVAGWMIGIPLLIVAILVVWAVCQPTEPFDIETMEWDDESDWPYDWKGSGL